MKNSLNSLLLGLFLTSLCAGVGSSSVHADEFATDTPKLLPLDYVPSPTFSLEEITQAVFPIFPLPTFSYTENLIAEQSSVKNQANRATCTIFASIGLWEWALKKLSGQESDLSEQWLEYGVRQNRTDYGSNGSINFDVMKTYGLPLEPSYPYGSLGWEDTKFADAKTTCGSKSGSDFIQCLPPFDIDDTTYLEIEKTCGHLALHTDAFKKCLMGQRDPAFMTARNTTLLNTTNPLYDPSFLNARNEAKLMKNTLSLFRYYEGFNSENRAKQFLAAGEPVGLMMPIHYAAWNHRGGLEHGVEINSIHWSNGIVTYPEPTSFDKEGGKHFVILVGYDDNAEIKKTLTLLDGTQKEFTYKGVYYFKNSWGQTRFGKDFELNGTKYPGYGVIAKKYVQDHRIGFFRYQTQ